MKNEIVFPDEEWNNGAWKDLLEYLTRKKVITWKELSSLAIGHLNPSQVGTSMASAEGFKRRYGKGNTMKVVMKWLYDQFGRCHDCGTRFELQADHINSKETFSDPLDADFIENMTIRCRRCNVIRRPSHVLGGKTHLTTESALMWILFVYQPRTLYDYVRLCRLYGMTMANIRMQEGWAMAIWLSRDPNVAYQIDCIKSGQLSNVLLWKNDGALTRCWKDDRTISNDYFTEHRDLSPNQIIYFVAGGPHPDKPKLWRITAFVMCVLEIPFSHYFPKSPQTLAVKYVPPKRETTPPTPPSFQPLPPRGMKLFCSAVESDFREWRVILHFPGREDVVFKINRNSKQKKLFDLKADEIEKIALEIRL
ncbi:MAG: hypothetical protein ACFFCW_09370 [Candidatus Hodarchaeota archaeon]